MIGIVGWKNSGKTTLLVRLVETFTRRGLKVATVKHAHHDLRPSDGTTDSDRHTRAGACEVIVASPDRWMVSGQLQDAPVPNLEDIAARLGPADIILVEGYKSAPIPKIEVRRLASATQHSLAVDDPHIIAVAADHAVETQACPVFNLDDVDAIAALIDQTRLKWIAGPTHHFRPE